MKQNNLLASVALFSELYNDPRYSSIYDIIATFIKTAVAMESRLSLNSTEITKLLKDTYNFDIPEAVIRTTLRNKLKKTVTYNAGYFSFNKESLRPFEKINEDFLAIQGKQKSIFEKLITYVEQKEDSVADILKREEIIENLGKYLLENGISERYSALISAFVVKNEQDSEFITSLNLVREGLVLYQGIKFTGNLNELGSWNTRLTIFLSPEYIFSALGLNGILFKEIFNDFYELVEEVNRMSQNKGGDKKIDLKILEETSDVLDHYFLRAERILMGKEKEDHFKPALKAILDGCKRISDIKEKKIKLERELYQLGISKKIFENSPYRYHEYVVNDEKVIEQLIKDYQKRERILDPNECERFFKIFTKVNYLRGGQNQVPFENVEYIYLTSDRLAIYLAHNSRVKFEESDTPFAKDIDFLTTKFWFKLKKGLGKRNSLPKTFDVVTKAQLVFSSQMSALVGQRYLNLQDQFKNGKLSEEEAYQRTYEMREKLLKPEEFTYSNIDKSLDFLSKDDYFEQISRERIKTDEAIAEIPKLKQELENYKTKEHFKELEAKRLEKANEEEVAFNNYWNVKINEYNKDLFYCFRCVLLTLLAVAASFFLRKVDSIQTQIGWWSSSILITLIIILLCFENIARSAIYNKERIKSGFSWAYTLTSRSKRKLMMEDVKKSNFKNSNIVEGDILSEAS